jgi:transposase
MPQTLEQVLEQNARLAAQNNELLEQNRLLHQKVQLLLNRVFGKKSEKFDPGQLELLFGGMEHPDPEPEPPQPPAPKKRKKRSSNKPRLPENLPVVEEVVDPAEVTRDPAGFRQIGEEITEELDVTPTRYFVRRTIRRKFVSKENRDRAPLVAPLEPRLIEGSYASASLLSDILIKKYVDHLPLYRQERILRERHGIELSRKTMCDWVDKGAAWLQAIYQHIAEELRQSDYMQIDETPVRYNGRDGGGSGKGYLWVYHRPGGDVLFEWHTSRAADCLDGMLGDFKGIIQSDGYKAYDSFATKRKGIEQAACWAHARRKFYEARDESGFATWMLAQIGRLYQLERRIADSGPALRSAIRCSHAKMLLALINRALRSKQAQFRPTSATGKAINYTLSLWDKLTLYCDAGQVLIDNNPTENAIRPTAIGKKNYLFFGAPEAGQRSAIIYTILESCRKHGVNQYDYLCDIFKRLPSMTNQQTAELTPAKWAEAQRQRLSA